MLANRKLDKALKHVLQPGETQLIRTFAEVKQGSGTKRLAKDLGVSLIASAALSATGFAVMRNTMPVLIWVVVTPRRLLMLERPSGRGSIGELVFDAPLTALRVTDQAGMRTAVLIDDAASGENLVCLNFGLRKKDGLGVAAAANGQF
jgi:hypothetical protein